MKEIIEEAIKDLAKKSQSKSDDSKESMQLSQAALNLANTFATFVHAENLKLK